ncbi:unnamed protein product, partial [Pleuronectes platessa]
LDSVRFLMNAQTQIRIVSPIWKEAAEIGTERREREKQIDREKEKAFECLSKSAPSPALHYRPLLNPPGFRVGTKEEGKKEMNFKAEWTALHPNYREQCVITILRAEECVER